MFKDISYKLQVTIYERLNQITVMCYKNEAHKKCLTIHYNDC